MKKALWFIAAVLSIVLTACNPPQVITTVPGPSQTWIDAPLTNATLPLLPYKVVFHGASFVGVTEFEVRINGNLEATVAPISTGSGGSQYGTMFLGEYQWNPPAPGTYQIWVRAKGNGVFSPPDQVEVTVSGGKDTPLPLEAKPSPTDTVAAQKRCHFTADINLFCRIGPGSGYREIDNFVIGQSAPVTGKSTDGYFWYVIGPNYGELCTVPSAPKYGKTEGACDQLPRFTPIPLPSPTPTSETRPTPCPAGVPCR